MNKAIATLDVAANVEPRTQWPTLPGYQELLDELARNDQAAFAVSLERRIDQINKVFFVLVGPSIAVAFGCLGMLWLGLAGKDALRPYALIASAWMSVAFLGWSLTLIGFCASIFYRFRKLGVTGLQARAMQLAKQSDELLLCRLESVSLLELEEAKDDFTHQSAQATTKSTVLGALSASITGTVKYLGEVFGFTPAGAPLPTYIGALFVGVGVGAAIYLSTKPKFDRMAHILGKAVRRAKERKPAPALDV